MKYAIFLNREYRLTVVSRLGEDDTRGLCLCKVEYQLKL